MTTYYTWRLIWYKDDSATCSIELFHELHCSNPPSFYTSRMWAGCGFAPGVCLLLCSLVLYTRFADLEKFFVFSVLFLPITSPQTLLNCVTWINLKIFPLFSQPHCLDSQAGCRWLLHKHILIICFSYDLYHIIIFFS